jgi:hypothetical protein
MRFSKAALVAVAAAVVLAPATAPAAAEAKPGKRAKAAKPKIKRVTPMRVEVGRRLVIRGTGFKPRKRRNTVIFRGAGGRTAFAKPRRASRRKLVVKIPASVARLLVVRNGKQRPTRLRLRVLAGKFSRFTPRRLSPVVLGVGSGTGPGTSDGGDKPPPPCTVAADRDDDGDLLSNRRELQIGTDPCLADTDGDGLSDGWEYWSAKDLNVNAMPYPGKRPFPNPLDPSDAEIDFDGDFLAAEVEYRLWRYTGSSFQPNRTGAGGAFPGSPLGYSDGTQASRPEETPAVPNFRTPLLNPGAPFDPPAYPARLVMHDDGIWTDDERDADNDGLNNYVEVVGPGQAAWWASFLEGDKWPDVYYGVFERRPFADLDPVDPDVDGDGLLDGEDDQDNDDIPNFHEMYDPAQLYAPTGLRKNAFNPCAPDPESRTCPLYEPIE